MRVPNFSGRKTRVTRPSDKDEIWDSCGARFCLDFRYEIRIRMRAVDRIGYFAGGLPDSRGAFRARSENQ
jgi:hypothetical protein